MLFFLLNCSNSKDSHLLPLDDIFTADEMLLILNTNYWPQNSGLYLNTDDSPLPFFENYYWFKKNNQADSIATHFVERPSN